MTETTEQPTPETEKPATDAPAEPQEPTTSQGDGAGE